MVVRRRKKIHRTRGRERTRGWGSSKKHRGKGSQGGKGKSGLAGKKGQHKVHTSFNIVGYERGAAKGFKRTYAERLEKGDIINVGNIELNMQKFIDAKAATKKGDVFEIDVSSLGYAKVLGSGKITKKMIIKAKAFSAGAKEKIEKAGGQAVII